MTTQGTHAIVSRAATTAATIAVTLALGACVPAPSRPALDGPATMDGSPVTIRFDNDAREHVHVYLVDGRQRQWLLGRVEPWSRATLRIPAAARSGSFGFVRLAVLTGDRVKLEAARDPRATVTIAQPASAILSQRWMFAQGELMSVPVRRAPGAVGRQ